MNGSAHRRRISFVGGLLTQHQCSSQSPFADLRHL